MKGSTLLESVARLGWPLAVLVVACILAIFGPALAPHSTVLWDVPNKLQPPSWAHFFGTDQYGRDVFSRMLAGTRSLVVVSASTALLALALGVTWGLLAAYLGGFQDELLMRGVDIAISVPEMLIAIVVLTVFGSSDITVIIAVAIVFAPYVARIIRSAALGIVAQEYVDAARAAGERSWYILFREILPNLQSVLLIEAAVRLSFVVLLVASLGYLGLGVQPPTPDWGLMVSDSQDYIVQAPWLVLFPGLGIGLIVVSCHALADRVAAATTDPGARDVLSAAAVGEIG